MNEKEIRAKYEKITKLLISRNLTVTTMESCTAGLIASLITDTEGASAVLKGAFVTYSNEAKILQGVPAETISAHGVYSKETALAMAKACRLAYHADLALGVTGTFGNADPDNPDSIPGEVFFALASAEGSQAFHITLQPEASRFLYKLAAADSIADRLLESIG